jgi:release factor glutamine methyltransferase
VGGALATARQILAASDTPRLDAELLLAAVLDVDRSRLIIDRDERLGGVAATRFWRLVQRRALAEPIAYILGRRAFRRLILAVDPRVLVPRPETELLVEVGLALPQGASVVDVGTGSGAVALALKDERPDLHVSGVDISADAVAVANGNASRLCLDVSFSVGDLLSNVCSPDAVLANLPYVEDGADLPADVADHEPPGALFGGPGGLEVVRRLVAQLAPSTHRHTTTADLADAARTTTLVALEIAPSQAAATAALVRNAGWPEPEILRDLAGRDRVVVGRRPAARP